MVADMVKDLKSVCPWISRHKINFAYNNYVCNSDNSVAVTVEASLVETSIPVPNVGGRPAGTANEAKHELKVRKRKCLNDVAAEFHDKKNCQMRQ